MSFIKQTLLPQKLTTGAPDDDAAGSVFIPSQSLKRFPFFGCEPNFNRHVFNGASISAFRGAPDNLLDIRTNFEMAKTAIATKTTGMFSVPSLETVTRTCVR
jgi:hypothetical protein